MFTQYKVRMEVLAVKRGRIVLSTLTEEKPICNVSYIYIWILHYR